MTDLATSSSTRDRFAGARSVADATLYEGYVLYPYRASSAKNQVRWQFGVLAPPAWAEDEGSERWRLRTECIVDPGTAPQLTVRVRFLHVQHRTVEVRVSNGFAPVDSLVVGGVRWVAWDEAVERVVDVTPVNLPPAAGAPVEVPFDFEAGSTTEDLLDADGGLVGRVVRHWDDVSGAIRVQATWAAGFSPLVKAAVDVANTSPWDEAGADRDAALARSLVGVHTLLGVDDGRFVSSLDPPADAVDAVADCLNDGSFPVLVGDPSGGPDVVLSSPITLYDHPVIAPESEGDFHDSTEIDEILALRVLTLTDEEKAEARGTDARSAAIVDRCDAMPPEVWERLHGAVRAVDPSGTLAAGPPGLVPVDEGPVVGDGSEAGDKAKPWWDPAVDAEVDPWSDSVRVGDVDVTKGTKVVLRPSRRADAHDLFLAGMDATVSGVFHDVDGTVQVAVSVDDDPATEALSWQGRYLFFFPDEIEVRS
ncbi:MAG: hypothetical protein ACR2LA_10035 [Acidimicrobiales bacterium]